MNVGFIGLGIMGSRMAANLMKEGHHLTVYNRTKEKAADLLEQGATWADSPAAVVKEANVLITMLAHPEAVEETALGDEGFLDAMNEGDLWVDSSTLNPSFSKRMAQEANARGIRFLDAPVLGTKAPAEQGELLFFVGGDETDVEKVRPLFDAMGKGTKHVGDNGMGTSFKMVVNHILATSMLAFSEGIALGEGLGLSQEALFDTLIGGPLVPAYMGTKRKKLEKRDYTPDFPLKWMQKDMQMVSTAAYDAGVPMPLANLTKELYQAAVKRGHGDEDFSAIYEDVKQG